MHIEFDILSVPKGCLVVRERGIGIVLLEDTTAHCIAVMIATFVLYFFQRVLNCSNEDSVLDGSSGIYIVVQA
jgi:hypothetical protein